MGNKRRRRGGGGGGTHEGTDYIRIKDNTIRPKPPQIYKKLYGNILQCKVANSIDKQSLLFTQGRYTKRAVKVNKGEWEHLVFSKNGVYLSKRHGHLRTFALQSHLHLLLNPGSLKAPKSLQDYAIGELAFSRDSLAQKLALFLFLQEKAMIAHIIHLKKDDLVSETIYEDFTNLVNNQSLVKFDANPFAYILKLKKMDFPKEVKVIINFAQKNFGFIPSEALT